MTDEEIARLNLQPGQPVTVRTHYAETIAATFVGEAVIVHDVGLRFAAAKNGNRFIRYPNEILSIEPREASPTDVLPRKGTTRCAR